MAQPAPDTPLSPADLKDIQGDIIFRKRHECFHFFTISNVQDFKKGLKDLIPAITTTEQMQDVNSQIKEHKAKFNDDSLIKTSVINIAFTYPGMKELGITESIEDKEFEDGQLAHAEALGDPGESDSDEKYTPKWRHEFKDEIHGVALVAGESEISVAEGLAIVHATIGSSTQKVLNIMGNVRPGKNKGHEHFGYLDGISQPAVRGVTDPIYPGQRVVRPGVLVLGQDGDEKASSRPEWARNGSILAYRHLAQLVPEFDKFLRDNPIPGILPRELGSQLRGARFFGRWKSGAPTQLRPREDDPDLGKDRCRRNDFDYNKPDPNDQAGCPFAAHIRKTNPRSDITDDPSKPPDFVEKRSIMRSAIPFGHEVTEAEEIAGESAKDANGEIVRGLAFVSYQSILGNGFEFMLRAWCNAKSFPKKFDAAGNRINPGFDPIVGQNGNKPRSMGGSDPGDQSANLTLPFDFVVSRGGAYFFSPSLTALNTVFVA